MKDEESGGIDRRELIKRAGLVGAAAFAAPTIISYPAGAQATGTPAEGCFRYAFGWDCLGCMQRLDSSVNYIYSAGTVPNRSCCPEVPGWNSLPNSDCITMTTGLINQAPGTNTCENSADTNFFVQFTVTCANCFIADPGVTFRDPGEADSCEETASSNDDAGGSTMYPSVRWNFTSTKYPRWFRFYVKCGDPSPCTVGAPFVKTL